MITREQYNKALDVIEAYNSQLFKTESKELLIDWVNRVELSVRTRTWLRMLSKWNDDLIFVNDVNKETFLQGKNIGIKSWWEFESERELKNRNK